MSLANTTRLRVGAVTCLVAWGFSLLLPAVNVVAGPELSGGRLLREGWRIVDYGVVAWFANPLFLASCLLGLWGRPQLATPLAAIALLLALTSFAAVSIARAAGASVPDISWMPGFYLWLASLFAWCVWATLHLRRHIAVQ